MKAAVLALVRGLVGLFYRRIEISGLENLPPQGPLLLVANHNNGLVDPMVVLKALPRPVVFVAKSTLWKIPGLRALLDVLGCVPVVRRRDFSESEEAAAGPARNEQSFLRLADVLEGGGCVLIFPEGRSHSDAHLSEMRTGAARVLLLSKKSPVVVPLGLWFTQKDVFRSDVLVKAGPPIAAPAEPTVGAWTDAIGAGLADVTLNADSWRDHEVVVAVEALYGRSVEKKIFLEGEEGEGQLGRSLRVRQLLLDARASLERTHPGEVASIARRARAFDHFLRRISLSPSSLDDPPPVRTIAWHTLKALAVLALGFPVAVVGVVAWWVPYRLTGAIANRLEGARERDQVALYKLVAGRRSFPLSLASLSACGSGRFAGALGAAARPRRSSIRRNLSLFSSSSTPTWRESQARELLTLLLAPGAIARLRAERDALVAECDRLAGAFPPPADNSAR